MSPKRLREFELWIVKHFEYGTIFDSIFFFRDKILHSGFLDFDRNFHDVCPPKTSRKNCK